MIRVARKEDLPELLAIYNREIRESTATFEIEEKTLEEWEQWFYRHQAPYFLLVCERDGHAVGYGGLSPYRSYAAYEESAEISLYVHGDYRGQGIGGALLKTLFDRAAEEGHFHMLISVISGENTESISFHERHGFSFCGRIRQAGKKFGRYIDIVNYQILLPGKSGKAGKQE